MWESNKKALARSRLTWIHSLSSVSNQSMIEIMILVDAYDYACQRSKILVMHGLIVPVGVDVH